ncbi:MAG: Holliday junction resolvase RuvX [bacterium]
MILGIDHGTKKTGLALGDEVTKIATPMDVINDRGEELISSIIDLIELEDITKIVVGMPLSESGEETEQSKIVSDFAAELRSRVEIPVVTVDEYLTSKYAEGIVKQSGGEIDAVAAAAILDDYFASAGDLEEEEEEEV